LRIDGDTVLVGTASTPVQLTDVQPEGRPVMSAAAWMRGVRVTADDVFE
jgi:methionyl-tRNA formyltransferase